LHMFLDDCGPNNRSPKLRIYRAFLDMIEKSSATLPHY
jgi:hypothetical protein